MAKKEKTLSITDEINNKAKEIIKQGDKTSLEAKKFEMINFLDEYYENFSGSSDLLIARKEEINFYTTTSKDFYSSILISILTSAMISSLFWFLDESEEISESTQDAPLSVKVVLIIILSIGIIIFMYSLFKSLINIHNERKRLSDYEELNVKEYEIELIDKILKQRFDNYKTEIENKNNSCNKNGGKNETTI